MSVNQNKELLLKNCLYIWRGKGLEPVRGGDIFVRDGKIERIGTDLQREIAGESCRTIDCSSHVIIPGLVNTHHHFFQTLTRNIPAVQNAELFDWLVHLYEIWKFIDEEAILNSSMLAMGELLKTGCTLSTDHHYLYPQGIECDIMATQFQAARRLGMRFSPTRGSMSLSKKDGGLPPDTVVQTDEEILADSERVISRFHDSAEFSMSKVVLAPCSPFSVSTELMKETARLGRKHGVRLHTHLAETRDENDYCLKTYNKRPLELLAECDFLGEDVSYAHGIYFTDKELEQLQETGTQIAHCPTSNMRLGSGICRVKEMRQMGINVALAVDGSASNDSSDMLGEVRNALLLQRVKYGAAAITGEDVMEMGTRNGALMLNFPEVGLLKEGFAADMAIFNVGRMEYAGALSDPLAALIFSGYSHGTDYTVVAGEVVVDQGKLVGVDEEELFAKANGCSEMLLNRHGESWR